LQVQRSAQPTFMYAMKASVHHGVVHDDTLVSWLGASRLVKTLYPANTHEFEDCAIEHLLSVIGDALSYVYKYECLSVGRISSRTARRSYHELRVISNYGLRRKVALTRPPTKWFSESFSKLRH
jgi:hypothetical protein